MNKLSQHQHKFLLAPMRLLLPAANRVLATATAIRKILAVVPMQLTTTVFGITMTIIRCRPFEPMYWWFIKRNILSVARFAHGGSRNHNARCVPTRCVGALTHYSRHLHRIRRHSGTVCHRCSQRCHGRCHHDRRLQFHS